jgi:lipoprotein-anchoring transpeptidase ErfK/SrfK
MGADDHTSSASTFPSTWILVVGVLVSGLCLGIGGPALAGGIFSQQYVGCIYPGVSVHDVDLGGLTVGEAAVTLETAFPEPATLPLVLRDGERFWSRSWADLKIRIDPVATARLAYQVGREGTPGQQRATILRASVLGHPLSPVILLPNPPLAREALQALAPDVSIPPVNATLSIGPDGVLPVPGQAGVALDVEATLAVLRHAVGVGREGLVMELLMRPVEPPIGDPGSALARVEELLSRPFTLVTDDPLTDFGATWSVEPDALLEWLAVQPIEDGDSAYLLVTVNEEAVRTYLEDLGSQLTEEVSIDVENTASAVRAAIETGGSQAVAVLAHHPHVYVVQPGDSLNSVAYAHGFPVWRLTEANPNIEPGNLKPGQQIVIPSVDVLFPLPLVAGRRIVVDISEQHLYVYEGDALVYSLIASTGIASSPTIPGVFQVLSKEEEAYASSWDLWMPHFMGIYRTGPDFTNGIHALPTLSSGVRLWEGYLGSPISYGCVVIGLGEAAALYDWTELGTLVVIQE